MAKNIALEPKKEVVAVEKNLDGSKKVVEVTKGFVADNLNAGKIKAEEKALEKDKARLQNIEATAAKAEQSVDELITQKKAEPASMPIEKTVVKVTEEKSGKSKSKKKFIDKWDINPLNRVRHVGTRALSGIAGLPSRVAAKINHIVARPQQLVSGQFYKDLGKNLLRAPKAMLTSVTGAVYKPHRDTMKFEDNYKDYGPEFANPTDKNKVVRLGKKALWRGGKIAAPTMTAGVWSVFPKFFANVGRGVNHAIHETFEGIKDSKWHWNPRKWNLNTWKYAKTIESFKKAFSRNKKGIPATGTTTKKETTVIDVTTVKEEKKAA